MASALNLGTVKRLSTAANYKNECHPALDPADALPEASVASGNEAAVP